MLTKILPLLLLLAASSTFAGEKDLYEFLWLDPDKSVYVLQNKVHPKDNSFYVDLGYASNQTSNFQDTTGAQLKAGYYFKEEYAIEFSYMQWNNSNNTAFKSVGAVNGAEPFVVRPVSNASVFFIWSPFYGKINNFNEIYYFDWSFGVGTGQFNVESSLDSNIESPNSPNVYKDETFIPVQLKTNVKFHVNKRVHVGLEFLNTNFQTATPSSPNTEKWRQNNDLVFSIGVSF